MLGLYSYGLIKIIQAHPDACKSLFVRSTKAAHTVDSNYLFSIMCSEYSEEGSTRKKIEECMMDFFQALYFSLKTNHLKLMLQVMQRFVLPVMVPAQA